MPELITDRQGLPQGFVPGLVQDRQGFIWAATHDGLCRYDGTRFKVFRPRLDGRTALSFSDLRSLQSDAQGRIWIVSEQSEIVSFDPRTEVFTNFTQLLLQRPPFNRVGIQHCYPDRQNRLWLALDGKGLLCFNLLTRRFRWFRHQVRQPQSLTSDTVRHVLEDKNGTIWVATGAGLDRFQPRTGNFAHYRPNSPTPLALPESNLYTLYLRTTGEILIGSTNYVSQFNPRTGRLRSHRLPASGITVWGFRFTADSRGLVYFDQRDRLFRFTDHQGLQLLTRLTPQTGFCSSLLIDHSDVLWLGTDGLGIRKYDLRTDGFETARYMANFQTDLLTKWLGVPPSLVKPFVGTNNSYHFRYTLDRQGAIWANIGSSVFYHINSTTRHAEKVNFPIAFDEFISPLATDEQGRVWVLHNSQFWWFDPQQHRWMRSSYQVDGQQTGEILQITVDEEAFWLATSSNGLFRLDRQTGKVRQYTHQPDQPTSLSSNVLYCLSADPQDINRLWVGTFGGGLCAFDKRSGRCRRITDQDGLPNNVIYSALPDQQGQLWIGTNKGLCRMDRKTFQIRVYTTEDGLLANEFNRFHYLTLPDDRIILGGVEGFTAFQPEQLRDDRFVPNVELTNLQINNRTVEPGAGSLLSHPIQAVKNLTLQYNQNFVTVEFAALQFNRPGKNRYRYQLEGIDQAWVETDRPQAGYTALPPGQYTLLVNASNTSGHWSRHVRQLGITITPPWWATWWAYVLYAVSLGGLIWYGLRQYLNRLQLQQAVELRQQEARQLRALDEMKSRFFTNVTHDFRTPLTLILSPMEGLLHDLAGSRYEKRLASIDRNAQQLLALINQLLDYSKLDAQALTVNEVRGNLADFVDQTVHLFGEEAAAKSIELTYQPSVAGDYWFDAAKLERIVSNLIANAVKFTPAGGRITVSLQPSEGVLLTVSDTGVGIVPEKLPSIFDRFFQVVPDAPATAPADRRKEGTGIGLALVKELVGLQGGQIDVESQPGQGTTFRVTLPYRIAEERPEEAGLTPTPLETTISGMIHGDDGEQPHLLLVEDNPELADFIADSLPATYRISRATNGAEGLEISFAELPDLVISDVMMPVMDGYTFCQKVKEDERTSHIPVILLTARTAFDSRMEGLSRGADDYLTKPFHVQELTLRIHNLLERQRRFRERMRLELTRPEGASAESANPPQSDPFLSKVYTAVEDKLDDASFSVEELADQLSMSRVHLHRKMKALTGLPTGDVVRNYRLKRATQYLREGLNSSETAYRVGFDSPAYFTKCFRELYRVTPLEFARQA